MKFLRRGSALAALAIASVLASGCGDGVEDFVVTRNAPVAQQSPVAKQSPIATNDTINALGNATLNQAREPGSCLARPSKLREPR
jgi:hypothetical protein